MPPIVEAPADAPRALLSTGRVSSEGVARLRPAAGDIRADSVNTTPVTPGVSFAGDWSVWVLTPADLANPAVPVVWDFTGGAWPEMCNARESFKGIRPGVMVRRTCTRRADHLGRHAAAAGGRIVAVWGVKHDTALVPLEVTA